MGRLFARQAKERGQRDELLSAYLDGELSAEERTGLEAQLATDPALRAELDALRRTVALVRELPPVPLPRNFILPQTMAVRRRPAPLARPRRLWAAPLLTAATAVVSLLFVVVLAGDLLFFRAGGAAFPPAAVPQMEGEAPRVALAPSPVSQEVEVEVEKVMPGTPAPTVVVEVPVEAVPEATAEAGRYAVETAEDMAATVPAAEGVPIEEAAAPAPTASPPVADEFAALPTSPQTPEGMESPEPAMGGGRPGEEATTPVPLPSPAVVGEATPFPTAQVTATAVWEKGVDDAAPAPSEVAEVAPPATKEEEPGAAEGRRGAPEREVAEPAAISPWLVLEVILGLTALGLALVTLWAWRARRR